MNNTPTKSINMQKILSWYSKITGILAIFFLASCSTLAPEVTPTIAPDLTQVDISLNANAITGTTTAMEYSLSSTDGFDGTWITASDGYTPVTFVEGNIYIREAANHQNVRLVKTIGPGMVIIVNLDDVGINVAEGNITETAVEMEYSLNSTDGVDGTWTPASNANTAVTFEAGKVYVRETADPGNMRLVATIAPAATAPTLANDDAANTITGLTSSHEYKIDAGTWTDGTVTPDLSGNKTVQVRVKATASALPSLIQTINFTAEATIQIVLQENFDLLTSLSGLGWGERVSTGNDPLDIPAVSTAQSVSPTKSLSFPGKGGIVTKKFTPDDTPLSNLTVEWKAYAKASTSFSVSLYKASASKPVIKTILNSNNFRYYDSSDVLVSIEPYAPDVWISYKIVITGNKYTLYKGGVPVVENLPTLGDNDGTATYLYFSLGNANAVFIDDIKISHPETP